MNREELLKMIKNGQMNKKELKSHVKDNGFYLNMNVEKIEKTKIDKIEGFSENAIETGIELPDGDGIMVFKGLASQNYSKGEKSRNGYKIDQNGWDFSHYLLNPIILLQHNSEYGGIGRALKFQVDNEGLNILFYVDLNTMDDKTAHQVKEGLISAISTGHITKDFMIEEVETGTRYTEEEAEDKFGFWNLLEALWGMSDQLIMVVTNALAIENSLVTIGSNEKALALPNALGNFFENYADALKEANKEKFEKAEKEYNENKSKKDELKDSDEKKDDQVKENAEGESESDEKVEDVKNDSENKSLEDMENAAITADKLNKDEEVQENNKDGTKEDDKLESENEIEEKVDDNNEDNSLEEESKETNETDEGDKVDNKEDDDDEDETKSEEADDNKVESTENNNQETDLDAGEDPENVSGNAQAEEDDNNGEKSEENIVEKDDDTKSNDLDEEINEIQKMSEEINTLKNELEEKDKKINSLEGEVDSLKNELEENSQVMDKAEKMINELTVIVNKAKAFELKQGLNYLGSSNDKKNPNRPRTVTDVVSDRIIKK